MAVGGGYPEGGRTAAAVLAEAADAAGQAPSIHNTQPWRWQVSDDALDLYADRSRQLGVADASGRMLLLSCGAGLHHARVAVVAEGWRAAVDRFPSHGDPDHLARLTLAEQVPVTPDAMRVFQATLIRRTDRRPVIGRQIEPHAMEGLRQAANGEDTRLRVLDYDQVIELAAAVERAEEMEVLDPAYRAELAAWVGGTRPEGTGVPDSALPDHFDPSGVRDRDFGLGRPGTLPVGGAVHDAGATYAVLHGDGDQPLNLLRAGEALSAVWLAAVAAGLALVPLTAVVEVAFTRELLRRMAGAFPYAVMKIGVPDPDHPGPPHTPRLSGTAVVRTDPAEPAS